MIQSKTFITSKKKLQDESSHPRTIKEQYQYHIFHHSPSLEIRRRRAFEVSAAVISVPRKFVESIWVALQK